MRIRGLDVRYGAAAVIHGMDLDLTGRTVSIVGRNGMGKTTLCHALTGMGPRVTGEILWEGKNIAGLSATRIAHCGIAIVPQGRRVFSSLTVDEHLRLAERRGSRTWTRDRVLQMFPRLTERLGNRGQQLSGGEQQMLAIARALLCEPRLLILDEPSEGLAPAIVEQLVETIGTLAKDGMKVILVEQNLRVAARVSDRICVLVSGQVALETDGRTLLHDRGLQSSLLGVAAG